MLPYQIPLWKKATFVRVVLFSIIGIWLQDHFQFEPTAIATIGLCMLVGYSCFYLLPLHKRYRYRSIHGCLVFAMIVSVAMLVTWNKDVRHQSDWYGHKVQSEDCFVVQLQTPPILKGKYRQVVGSVQSLIHDGKRIPVTGNMSVFLPMDGQPIALQYGDILMLRGKWQLISQATNPGGFNYRVYMSRQQIFHSIRVDSFQYRLIARHQGNWIVTIVFQLRAGVLNQLNRFIRSDPAIKGIAEALLIGYKEHLEGTLMQSYSNTGLVHIIAISGLHLGVIYMLLLFLFDNISFVRRLPLIKWLSVLVLLWLFTLMTGASASVLRSAVMFTCIIFGKVLQKRASIEQSLAVSAGLLLAYNPFFLWDVGFQLSYLAIMGIVGTQRFFQTAWYSKYVILQKTWALLSTTLAAQVFTFPICIYYFHQFPNLFFLSNLIVVPLSTLLLFGLLLLICVSPFGAIALWVGNICSVLIDWMNQIVQVIDAIPGSVSQPIYANVYTTIALYGCVCGLWYWWSHQHNRAALYSLGSFFIFLSIHVANELAVNQQKKIIVYHMPKQSAIDVLYQQQCMLIGPQQLTAGQAVKNTRIFFHAWESINPIPAFRQTGNYFAFASAHWMVLDRHMQLPELPPTTCIDFVVLSNNAPISIRSIQQTLHPAIIVFDGSNSLWKIDKWKKECEAVFLPCYSVPEKGAFVYSVS